MRIAITGTSGQLGHALLNQLSGDHEIIPFDHSRLELTGPAAIEQLLASNAELVIHAAAYTNVDGCARDPDLAYRANGLGTKYVALACRRLNAPLLYISTNEVFDGAANQPYREYDPVAPINAYGAAKLAGEQAVRELLRDFYIVRVAWLFGGERNFVRTVLRLAANPPAAGISMVADEIGNPTYSVDVAAAVAQLIRQPCYGTYHFVNQGSCSRYEFARVILQLTGQAAVPLRPIRLVDFQRDSRPPPCTPLANLAGAALGIELRPWQDALSAYLAEIGYGV
jgi:dTDP-4-dehydrorhamnose reductase